MANSKKKTEQVIVVDARKLSQGLKMAFEGVAMVFDSIGVDAGFEVEEKVASAKGKAVRNEKSEPEEFVSDKEASAEVKDKSGDTGEEKISQPDTSGHPDTARKAAPAAEAATSGKTDTSRKADPAVNPDPAAKTEKKEDTPAISPITRDDVTKIIVQKIKQNRSNNEKIGQILKTYGAAKVGELDASKYEAFLTDVAAL